MSASSDLNHFDIILGLMVGAAEELGISEANVVKYLPCHFILLAGVGVRISESAKRQDILRRCLGSPPAHETPVQSLRWGARM